LTTENEKFLPMAGETVETPESTKRLLCGGKIDPLLVSRKRTRKYTSARQCDTDAVHQSLYPNESRQGHSQSNKEMTYKEMWWLRK
jgi:hypothetical protein